MVERPQCFTIIGTINIKQINYLNKLRLDAHINLMDNFPQSDSVSNAAAASVFFFPLLFSQKLR